MKIYFVDFEDSFSFNVINSLKEIHINPEFLNINEWKSLIQKTSQEKVLTILGPGPGHPHDYKCSKILKWSLAQKNHFYFGVCLGHQLLAEAIGLHIQTSSRPVHGQSLSYRVPLFWQNFWELPNRVIQLQRYNSLAPTLSNKPSIPIIKSWVYRRDLMCMMGKNWLSYQFHPESIGTSFRSHYFYPIRRFIL